MAQYFKFKPDRLVSETYKNNGRTAILQIDDAEAKTDAVLTVNVPEAYLKNDEVIIKNYSENEGVLEDLVGHGIVSKPDRYISSGYVDLPVCKLLKKPMPIEVRLLLDYWRIKYQFICLDPREVVSMKKINGFLKRGKDIVQAVDYLKDYILSQQLIDPEDIQE